MTRSVHAALAALLPAAALLAAAPARAQVATGLERQAGAPGGLVLPVTGAAAADEPTALGVNPAGVGFVPSLALMYFHEGAVTAGSEADGLYAATGLGPLATGLSMEWVRPGDGGLARYRRTKLALGLADGRSVSAAIAWSWYASHDAAVAGIGGYDLGVAWRPLRHLALGASALGLDAREGGTRLPVRYDLGVATRLLDDTYTLSADLIASDRARNDFWPSHVALGLGADWPFGVGLGVQVQIPIRSDPSVPSEVATLFSVAWNARHAGLVAGGAALPGRTSWLTGARLSSEPYRSAERGSDVPVIDVDDALDPPGGFLGLFREADPYGRLVRRLERARDDASVAGLVLVVGDLPVGLGRAEELRALVARIRERKPVLVYLRGGGTRDYVLATAAQSVASPPGATLFVNGLGASSLYLRAGLARLGISFDVVRAGAYKTATEPLVREGPSPEAREVTDSILDDVFARQLAAISEARRIPPERVRALVDRGVFTSEEARDAGLVDAVIWPDEIEGWARRELGRRVRVGGDYEPERPRAGERWGRPAVIAVVPVEGTIVGGRGGGLDEVAGAEGIARSIRRAASDREVRAIVLRVDSPGGDGFASDLVWREVMRARRRGKPVIASAGDLAASGGYLVAVAADVIVAEPSTLTGSIGVFALKPDLSGLLEKLSVRRSASSRGENAQILSFARPWSPAERALVEAQVQAFYRSFVERVAQGRNLPAAEVEKIAGGRVWTGKQALERHLVDRLGTFADAVALARERAGLRPGDAVEVRRYAPARGGFARLASGADADADPALALLRAASSVPEIRVLALLARMGPVVALPPGLVEPLAGP